MCFWTCDEHYSGWWLNQPISKICVSQNGFIFPHFRGEYKKYLSCHHLVFFPNQTAGCLSFGYWWFHRTGFFRESINSIWEIKNTEKNENSCQRKRLERAQNPTTLFQKSLDRNLWGKFGWEKVGFVFRGRAWFLLALYNLALPAWKFHLGFLGRWGLKAEVLPGPSGWEGNHLWSLDPDILTVGGLGSKFSWCLWCALNCVCVCFCPRAPVIKWRFPSYPVAIFGHDNGGL